MEQQATAYHDRYQMPAWATCRRAIGWGNAPPGTQAGSGYEGKWLRQICRVSLRDQNITIGQLVQMSGALLQLRHQNGDAHPPK